MTALGLARRELGYNKLERQFSLKDADGKHPMKALEGTVLFDGADGVGGHLYFLSTLEGEPEAAKVHLPQPACYLDEVPVTAAYADWWQCCFIRKDGQFRIWTVGKPRKDTELFFDDVRGPAYLSWHDRGGHIYIHGRLWVTHEGGKAVLNIAGDFPSDFGVTSRP